MLFERHQLGGRDTRPVRWFQPSATTSGRSQVPARQVPRRRPAGGRRGVGRSARRTSRWSNVDRARSTRPATTPVERTATSWYRQLVTIDQRKFSGMVSDDHGNQRCVDRSTAGTPPEIAWVQPMSGPLPATGHGNVVSVLELTTFARRVSSVDICGRLRRGEPPFGHRSARSARAASRTARSGPHRCPRCRPARHATGVHATPRRAVSSWRSCAVVDVAAGLRVRRTARWRRSSATVPSGAAHRVRHQDMGVQRGSRSRDVRCRNPAAMNPSACTRWIAVAARPGERRHLLHVARPPAPPRPRAPRPPRAATSGSPRPHRIDTDFGARNVRSHPGTFRFLARMQAGAPLRVARPASTARSSSGRTSPRGRAGPTRRASTPAPRPPRSSSPPARRRPGPGSSPPPPLPAGAGSTRPDPAGGCTLLEDSRLFHTPLKRESTTYRAEKSLQSRHPSSTWSGSRSPRVHLCGLGQPRGRRGMATQELALPDCQADLSENLGRSHRVLSVSEALPRASLTTAADRGADPVANGPISGGMGHARR